MTVVCCVDSSINARTICLQNCVSYTKLSEIEIDEMMYGNSNRASCGYGGYSLEPIPWNFSFWNNEWYKYVLRKVEITT